MAFGFFIFIFAILHKHIDSQNTTDVTEETKFEEEFTSQVIDDNITTSTTMTNTDNFDEGSTTDHYSSSAISISWENSSTSGEWIKLEETLGTFPASTSSGPGTSTWRSSKGDVTYFGEEPEGTLDPSTDDDNKSSSTPQPLHNASGITEDGHLSPDVSNVTDSNVTDSPGEWISTYSSRESHDYKSNSSRELQEDILILLKSNCTIVNAENFPLNDVFAEAGCTIYLRINISLGNGTREKLLSSLRRLTIKPNDFQIVRVHDQTEDASQQKHHNYLLEPETFAYLAIASCFAFLFLLAIIVFGFRCFKKRKSLSDVSPFDVKLSSYTLTKIPRASLTSMDCSRASDSLAVDDKTELPVRSRNCGSCESDLDIIIPCDTFSSNREMKTFGVSRSNCSRNTDSPSDMYPQHSAIAYENNTFQRYF